MTRLKRLIGRLRPQRPMLNYYPERCNRRCPCTRFPL